MSEFVFYCLHGICSPFQRSVTDLPSLPNSMYRQNHLNTSLVRCFLWCGDGESAVADDQQQSGAYFHHRRIDFLIAPGGFGRERLSLDHVETPYCFSDFAKNTCAIACHQRNNHNQNNNRDPDPSEFPPDHIEKCRGKSEHNDSEQCPQHDGIGCAC